MFSGDIARNAAGAGARVALEASWHSEQCNLYKAAPSASAAAPALAVSSIAIVVAPYRSLKLAFMFFRRAVFEIICQKDSWIQIID
jgi:hypothetical protein